MTHHSTQFSAKPDLTYPFELGFSPSPGKPLEVADGVFWLRMPMPMGLDHINLWLLRDGDEWVIVDSGLDAAECRAVWDQVFDEFLTEQSVNKVIVTHFHPDHIGLAAPLANRCQCPIWITKGEFEFYDYIVQRSGQDISEQQLSFIRELGTPEKYVERAAQFFSVDQKDPRDRVQRNQVEFICAGETFDIGGRQWRIVGGNGHSPEHACLYCEELNLLISGDQALPRISSHIGVSPAQPDANPLADWLESCARLRDAFAHDLLVLPAHQEPFIGLHLRMQQMIDDHHAQLNRLRQGLTQPMSVLEVIPLMFDRELDRFQTMMASSEARAHLNYLLHSGAVQSDLDERSIRLYQTV